MAITLDNPGMLKGIFDGFYNTGPSLKGGKNIQEQIASNGVQAPTIHGWRDANGKEYSTSVAQQVAFNAQGIAAIRSELGAIKELLQQVATAANKGVAVNIDYDRIKSMMPKYELVASEQKETK